MDQSTIVLYEWNDGNFKLDVHLENETVRLSQEKMAELFVIDRTVITKHIKNIYKEQELDEFSTSAKIAQIQMEGTREVQREIKY